MHKIIFLTLVLTQVLIANFNKSTAAPYNLVKSGEFNKGQNESKANLRGKVTDGNNNSLQGASIIIVGAEKGVNANEGGYYLLEKLQAGNLSVQVSIMGYETQTADIELKPGHNEMNFILVENIVHLDPVVVVAKKREQQILDVPAAISVIESDFIDKNNIVELGQLSDYVPGLFIYEQGANRPSFIIRGLTSEEVSPSAQPRVSIYQNNVPINRASGSSVSLFDMERVEVLKGPQNTLFGRGAQIGAIHFISKSPSNTGEGYLSAGFGNYNQKEFRGAINIPLIENKLFVRAAGIYDYRDGYAQNTFGGTLNGKNTLAGRLSFRLLPSKNQQLDLILNYQKDDTPGIAFMSKQFPNAEGNTSIFDYRASLEQGKNLKTGKELFDATLYYRYNINEHTYLSSTSSYRKISSSSRWDGDGTAAPAIDMWDGAGADQIYQEIRYNYSLGSRLIGSAGVSYWHEDADQTYWFSPNEQSMAVLFLNPEYLILPNGQPLLIPALPDDPSLGPLAGMPLPSEHEENNYSAATNQAVEVFYEGTYQLMSRLFLTGGVRTAYENFNLKNQAALTGGSPSTLGMMTGNYPNLFFRPGEEQSIDNANWSFNWQAGLQYKITEYSNFFINYANGRRPVVLQFTAIGTPEVLPAENVENVDVGLKSSIAGKIFFDAVTFYQKYNDFQSRAWIADPETGEFDYVTVNGGKATSHGVETSISASLLKGLNVFGNYAYLNATFDDENQNGSEQEYAGNTFRLSPNHTFSLGFNAQTPLTSGVQAFITPSYAYRSHYYFEDANTPELEQPGFGLLNLNLGIEFEQPKLTLIFFGTNLLNQEYLISAGNTGSLFGVPTFVPGPPRMLGTKLTWMFHVK